VVDGYLTMNAGNRVPSIARPNDVVVRNGCVDVIAEAVEAAGISSPMRAGRTR